VAAGDRRRLERVVTALSRVLAAGLAWLTRILAVDCCPHADLNDDFPEEATP
jgi:hypothetical protein